MVVMPSTAIVEWDAAVLAGGKAFAAGLAEETAAAAAETGFGVDVLGSGLKAVLAAPFLVFIVEKNSVWDLLDIPLEY
jgi:hypothetical protein